MAQRLVRAKHKIATPASPTGCRPAAELPERLDAVLRVAYLVFREGYAPTAGDDLVRADLRDEAVRLARLLAELLPDQGEVLGLLALLLLHDSRRATRVDGDGDLVLLADQDRTRWDHAAIGEGLGLAGPPWPGAGARTPSRPASPPATRRRRRRRSRSGGRSPGSTTSCPASTPDRRSP